MRDPRDRPSWQSLCQRAPSASLHCPGHTSLSPINHRHFITTIADRFFHPPVRPVSISPHPISTLPRPLVARSQGGRESLAHRCPARRAPRHDPRRAPALLHHLISWLPSPSCLSTALCVAVGLSPSALPAFPSFFVGCLPFACGLTTDATLPNSLLAPLLQPASRLPPLTLSRPPQTSAQRLRHVLAAPPVPHKTPSLPAQHLAARPTLRLSVAFRLGPGASPPCSPPSPPAA